MRDATAKGPKPNLCGRLIAFLFGATPEQKIVIVAKDGVTSDFHRATTSFLNRMFENRKLMGAFVRNGQIDQDLAKAAIRSQNWMPLLALGQAHRALKFPGLASEIITHGFPWGEFLIDGEEVPNVPGNCNPMTDYRKCTVPDLQSHVKMILEGRIIPFLRCEGAYSA